MSTAKYLDTSSQTSEPVSTTNYLDRAVEIVQRAIDEDLKQNFTKAYKLYNNALDYFTLALKYEKNEKSKVLIRNKVNECLTRAETIKEYIFDSFEKRGGAIDVNGSGGATGPGRKLKSGSVN